MSLEVPKGIDLLVHTTASPVRADTLEQKNILISVHSDNMELGTVTAERVDLSSSSGFIRADSVSVRTLRCSASSGAVAVGTASSAEKTRMQHILRLRQYGRCGFKNGRNYDKQRKCGSGACRRTGGWDGYRQRKNYNDAVCGRRRTSVYLRQRNAAHRSRL